MKICHVLDSLEVGGAEVLVTQLCRLQKDAGHEPAVQCLFAGGPLESILHESGVAVQVHTETSQTALMLALFREFGRTRPDIVHSHNAAAGILSSPAAWVAAVPGIVNTRHGLVSGGMTARREMKFWLAARFCDAVVAVCRAAEANLARSPLAIRNRIRMIYNASLPARDEGGQIGGPPPKRRFTLINVARLAVEKDHITLLHAFRAARQRRLDLDLWIVGDGRLKARLSALAAELELGDAVVFAGERRDVGRWLAAADLFVLSSQSEGLPISLLESLAAGLPHIVTDVGGMVEVAQLSGAGCIVPSGQPEALAHAILEAAFNTDLAPLRRRALDCYRRHFTAERMAAQYLELYRSCLPPGHAYVNC